MGAEGACDIYFVYVIDGHVVCGNIRTVGTRIEILLFLVLVPEAGRWCLSGYVSRRWIVIFCNVALLI
jgi:hypothetical protein